jgi:GT2 family glycosyltransferase
MLMRSVRKISIKLFEVYKSEGLYGIWMRIRIRIHLRYLMARYSLQHLNRIRPSLANRRRGVVRHHQSVDVIVCVHNALDDVKRCLESLLCNTYPPYHLIIVDDGSGQETKDYLEGFAVGQPATLIRNDTATGYTRAANTGMRASQGDFVVLLNSDTIVPPLWVDRLIQCANSSDEIGMVGPLSNTASWQSVPLITNENGDWANNPLPARWSVNDYANEVARVSPRIYPRVGFLNGFCLLIKRKLIADIGLFDEETFVRGYGEENDFSLRATKSNWQLAVADDCYVYHAQSKSYSHQRRFELVRLAGEALARKHGQAWIGHNLSLTQHHPALHYIRRRCAEIEQISSHRAVARRRFEGKRVLFLLPAVAASGGTNIVLLEAACMREMGVDAWVANLEIHRHLVEKNQLDRQVPVLYLLRPADLLKVASDFDAVVATLYLTIFWMEPIQKLEKCPALGYYIQDFEPDFFDNDSLDYQNALASYTAIANIHLFTKTTWTQQALQNKSNVSATVIGPSLDIDRFHPSPYVPSSSGTIKILAMVRPITPRRAPETTMRVLKRLAQRFGTRIRITIFGVNRDDPKLLAYPNDFAYNNLGEINAQAVAEALADTDIFVDCSIFQAMGLTAMEAMASGVAVVGPANGGLKEIIVDGHNGILVDTQDEDSIVSAVSQLITDSELRAGIQRNALEVLTYSPELSSFKILDCLFPEASSEVQTVLRRGCMMPNRPLRVHVLYESSHFGSPHGCSVIRLLRPLSHPSIQAQLTVTQGLAPPAHHVDVLIIDRLWDQICEWQRHHAMLQSVRKQGTKVIFQIDDDLLSVNSGIGGYDWPTTSQKMWLRQMVRFADGVMVTTAELANRLAVLNPHIEIVENALDERLFERSREFALKEPDDVIVFGYMGTFSHLDDLMSIIKPMRSVLARYSDRVCFEIVGVGDNAVINEAFAGLPVRFLSVPPRAVLYENFAAWMQDNIRWDFGIAPLIDSIFTRSKSDIKFLDYGVQGIPGIFSDMPAYNSTVKHLVNGILATDAHSWEAWLEKLILDAPLRAELAKQAHADTWKKRMLKSSAANWLKAINKLTLETNLQF